MDWFGARTLYLHKDLMDKDGKNLYEERIVLISANDFDDAIAKAETEANEYIESNSEIEFLEFVNVFKIFDSKIKDKTEVYSLMRTSKLSEEEYITAFFDTGTERMK